jgi:hypothetical protein
MLNCEAVIALETIHLLSSSSLFRYTKGNKKIVTELLWLKKFKFISMNDNNKAEVFRVLR